MENELGQWQCNTCGQTEGVINGVCPTCGPTQTTPVDEVAKTLAGAIPAKPADDVQPVADGEV